MINILIKEQDQAAKQGDSSIAGAQEWNLKEIRVFNQVGKWRKDPNCIGTFIDDSPGYWVAAIPIFKTDNLDAMLNRYLKVFRWEYVEIVDQVKEAKACLFDEKGYNPSKTMRMNSLLPETLTMILKKCFPYYLKTKRGLGLLRKRLPELFI